MTSALNASTLTIPATISEEATLVRDALRARGLETPLTSNELTRDEKYAVIKNAFTDITKTLGLDLTDDSLAETPHRIAKMYVCR